MIRATSTSKTITTTGVDNQITAFESPLVREIGQQVALEYQPLIQETVNFTPPKIGEGVFKKYATRKQLIKVMILIRQGEWTGRTGNLQNAWVIQSLFDDGSFTMVVENTAPSARFVYGSLALSRNGNPLRFQQTYHTVTGWPAMADQLNPIYDALQTRFANLLTARLQGVNVQNARRGYTSPRPRKG